KHAYCLKTQPATGETYPKSDLFNKALLSQTTDTFAAFLASSVCKFTQILQLPQNTKGGIARC
ncbi:hypothetical protein ACJWRY_28880, partial [Klebsiella pneumoniae]